MASTVVKLAIRKLFADVARSGAGKEAFQELGKIIKDPPRLWKLLKQKGLIDDTINNNILSCLQIKCRHFH